MNYGSWNYHLVLSFVALALWSLLVWKLWTRPQSWSLGIGIFLLLVLAFQIYLWCLAVSAPARDQLGIFLNPAIFACNELPLALAAACCLILRRLKP